MISILNQNKISDSLSGFFEIFGKNFNVSDGSLSVRVTGEFSSGKTRFIRELISGSIPESLFPISSQERQTRLLLEVTYGSEPTLSLVKRSTDTENATELKRFSQFPERQDVAEQDPQHHRLRLTLPDEQFILMNGDGVSEDQTPKRFFLIDTPGWNSTDDPYAEMDSVLGSYNLALVYVVQATRLDSSIGLEKLSFALDAVNDGIFLGNPKLLVVITYCHPSDQEHLIERMRSHILGLWKERSYDEDLSIDIFAIDFSQIDQGQSDKLRRWFWASLQDSLLQNDLKVGAPESIIDTTPDGLLLVSKVMDISHKIERAKNLLAKARVGNEFVLGMNTSRLRGLSQSEVHKKVYESWLRQLGCSRTELWEWDLEPLPVEHFLHQWWNAVWHQNALRTIGSMRAFFLEAERIIYSLPAEPQNVQRVIYDGLLPFYNSAIKGLSDQNFIVMIDSANSIVRKVPTEQIVPALINLSFINARYSDVSADYLF